MFLKRLDRRKNGKRHTYWALVESIRTERGSRHHVVTYLGELTKRERTGWAQLGRRLNGQGKPQPSLFDPPHYDDPTDDEPVLVKLKDIRLQRLRDFGDVWLALGLWRLLGLDTLLSELMPAGREEVAWPVVAAILTIARFCGDLHFRSRICMILTCGLDPFPAVRSDQGGLWGADPCIASWNHLGRGVGASSTAAVKASWAWSS